MPDSINKDVANSLSKYMDYTNKVNNLVLDGSSQINTLYQKRLYKVSEDIVNTRLETNVRGISTIVNDKKITNNLKTHVIKYNKIQTNNTKNLNDIQDLSKIKTQTNNLKQVQIENLNKINSKVRIAQKSVPQNNRWALNKINPNIVMVSKDGIVTKIEKYNNADMPQKINRIPKKISEIIKSAKFINNISNRTIQIGKKINTGTHEDGIKSIENNSSRIMTKTVKKIGKKVKKLRKVKRKKTQQNSKILVKVIKALTQIMLDVAKMLISMLPSIAPIVIILLIVICFISFFGVGMTDEVRQKYEDYMISTQNEYDNITVMFYNEGKIVEGTLEGKGMINWRAPLAIIQMLNGNLEFDSAEKELLDIFKNAKLFEEILDVKYTYEKETEEIDKNGNKTTKKEKITENKKVVRNPSIEDFINWCNKNFSVINDYKQKKQILNNPQQMSFSENDIEQIKMLYNSNTFFQLFSNEFKNMYSYMYVQINDKHIQAIYEEFLKNVGKRYIMDHSNLRYDECMEYYDCSSWVIHVLGHTGIKTIPNTGATGIYKNYCIPIPIEDRKPGDLIFLKDTYDTGKVGSISHIGIYMGVLTINNETSEYVIDTGGNPSGVRIRKYENGWWNGSHFYAFGRLK